MAQVGRCLGTSRPLATALATACRPAAHHQFRVSSPDLLTAMADPQLTPRTPLLLRSAAWRLVGAALISAVLIALWRWALSGGGAA